MSCYWYLTLDIHISAFWSQWSTSSQNLFCERRPPETLNQLVQILTEILRNSFNFNWQVENPVGNTELAIFECGQWNIRPTIEAAARPRLRSDAPALLCRSFWINTRIFSSQWLLWQPADIKCEILTATLLERILAIFLHEGGQKGDGLEKWTHKGIPVFTFLLKPYVNFLIYNGRGEWLRTTRDTCVLSIYSSTEGVQAVSLAKMLLLFLLPPLVSGAAYQPGTPGAPWSEQELLTGDFSFKF